MATRTTRDGNGLGFFQPELSRTFLPGCRQCGGSHPLARKQALDPGICPDCGAPQQPPGPTRTEKALLSGGAFFAAGRAFLAVGETLTKFAKGL